MRSKPPGKWSFRPLFLFLRPGRGTDRKKGGLSRRAVFCSGSVQDPRDENETERGKEESRATRPQSQGELQSTETFRKRFAI